MERMNGEIRDREKVTRNDILTGGRDKWLLEDARISDKATRLVLEQVLLGFRELIKCKKPLESLMNLSSSRNRRKLTATRNNPPDDNFTEPQLGFCQVLVGSSFVSRFSGLSTFVGCKAAFRIKVSHLSLPLTSIPALSAGVAPSRPMCGLT